VTAVVDRSSGTVPLRGGQEEPRVDELLHPSILSFRR
jgi:hypothetical protein